MVTVALTTRLSVCQTFPVFVERNVYADYLAEVWLRPQSSNAAIKMNKNKNWMCQSSMKQDVPFRGGARGMSGGFPGAQGCAEAWRRASAALPLGLTQGEEKLRSETSTRGWSQPCTPATSLFYPDHGFRSFCTRTPATVGSGCHGDVWGECQLTPPSGRVGMLPDCLMDSGSRKSDELQKRKTPKFSFSSIDDSQRWGGGCIRSLWRAWSSPRFNVLKWLRPLIGQRQRLVLPLQFADGSSVNSAENNQ